jgi:hypothetical protein|tara:strand:- start:446 stop:781 length:336 start_codon:yes stop_codon:yes gene_type:complete
MGEILLGKKEALRIAITVLNKEKNLEDYGFTAIKESELILKNILESLKIEEQMLARPKIDKPKSNNNKKKPNKKIVEAEMAYLNKILGNEKESDNHGKTILDLEGKKDEGQ